MGYSLWAFIARSGTFDKVKSLSPYITVANLRQGFDLLLNDRHLEAVIPPTLSHMIEGLEKGLMNASVYDLALRWSEAVPIAYVEAHFFGGNGYQTAIAWKGRQVIALPSNNGVMGKIPDRNGPINVVLRAIGVQTVEPDDEFLSLGLRRHRENASWFLATTGFDMQIYDPDGDWGEN